jgi:protein-tyrosine phosphatase
MESWTMTRFDNLPRQLDFEGPNNFRDMGGYPLDKGGTFRHQRLYRSDHLATLTDADQRLLAELGIRTVIDLRRESEREDNPDRIADPGIRQIWLPVTAEGADVRKLRRGLEAGTISVEDAHDYLIQANLEFVCRFASVYRRFIELLLDESNYPLVFHCSAGKDRVGFGAAMVLLASGASMETVFHDYLATNHCTAHYVNGIVDGLSDMPLISKFKASPEAVRVLMQARVEYLQAAFDAIAEHYGSVDAFLEQALGLSVQKRQQIRALLSY